MRDIPPHIRIPNPIPIDWIIGTVFILPVAQMKPPNIGSGSSKLIYLEIKHKFLQLYSDLNENEITKFRKISETINDNTNCPYSHT